MLSTSKPIDIFKQRFDEGAGKCKQTVFVGMLSVLCLCISGCMQFSLAAGGDKDEMTKNGAVYYGSYYDFWWGNSPEDSLLEDLENRQDEEAPRSLYQVMYSSNALYSFVSLVSLGIFVPVDVRWYLTDLPAEEYQGPIRKKQNKESLR